MADKAVFLDRDNTIIEDPGYLSDPDAVKLLPGVELALKSLSQAGYRLVVVTNQSGIARGLLTEAALERIHAEMRRQLAQHNVHLDAVFHCPYHPEGTVEQYARESDLRKPQPGMLLAAARDLDLDLGRCWMVGDRGRDIEAGQRAGCRTVRIRSRPSHTPGEKDDEDVQADFNARNLVDAARVVLREDSVAAGASAAPARAGAPAQVPPPAPPPAREREPFRAATAAGVAAQVLAPVALVAALWSALSGGASQQAVLWALVALTLQVMALTFFITRPRR
jgi:D-glycero-D-manno-heptose 1,7-bisphosphate phosphatase